MRAAAAAARAQAAAAAMRAAAAAAAGPRSSWSGSPMRCRCASTRCGAHGLAPDLVALRIELAPMQTSDRSVVLPQSAPMQTSD
eukprot:170008-Chlamydomonas_euryale.AAC.1